MKNVKIFIVDDDQDFAKSLSNLLIGEGHKVKLAFSGEEAVSKFRDGDYDVTFMDVKLPGMNGVESFFALKKIKPKAKVIMMTAFTVEQLLQQAIDGGAVATLQKPIDMDELLEVLEKAKPEGIVLVVDDDPAFTKSIENLLVQEGYKVLIASTGEEAVEKALANRIDVLILDLRLPILSGLEVYLELKKRDRAVPTIILTAYANDEEESIDRLKDSSVSGCLNKPFDVDELLQMIDEFIK